MFFCLLAMAQSFVGISSGIDRDVNSNKNATFYHIPVVVQWKPFAEHHRSYFIMELNYGIPFTGSSTASAYTLNPNLPAAINLQEQIRPYIFTGSVGIGWHIFTDKQRDDAFYFNFLTGICNQSFRVEYEHYDNKNYEILNPDESISITSVAFIGEAEYKFHNNIIILLRAQTPLLIGYQGKYPLSYTDVAPLQLTFGYNFYYNKNHIDRITKRKTRYEKY
jgi:hypothetical protein